MRELALVLWGGHKLHQRTKVNWGGIKGNKGLDIEL